MRQIGQHHLDGSCHGNGEQHPHQPGQFATDQQHDDHRHRAESNLLANDLRRDDVALEPLHDGERIFHPVVEFLDEQHLAICVFDLFGHVIALLSVF